MKITRTFFNPVILFVIIVSILIGVIGTLFIPALRYTHFVEPTIGEITPQETYKNIIANPENSIFIDVRTPYEYAQAHATTSISVPINTFPDIRKELPLNKDKEIYLICTSGKLAGVAYSYLEHYGFRNIHRVTGGIQRWSEVGLPVVAKDLFAKPVSGEAVRPMLDIPFVPTTPH